MNRGGSWNNNGSNCRAANRNRNPPSNRNNNLGFRLAQAPSAERTLDPTEPTAFQIRLAFGSADEIPLRLPGAGSRARERSGQLSFFFLGVDEGLTMPSASLLRWQNDRMPSLAEIDRQCAASLALTPPNLRLAEENLRGYVVLLSAHFQGFCRNLHLEAAQVVASKVRPSLQLLVQTQFSAHRTLDHGNPNVENLAKDFDRFGFDLKAALAADPANAPRSQHLAALNRWRNVAAHHSTTLPPGMPLTLSLLQTWRVACDELAFVLDGTLYNQLRRLLRRKPW